MNTKEIAGCWYMDFRKPTKIRSNKILKSAKGEACTLHTPWCNGNPETTVFCHAPSEAKGMGTKSDDTWGAYGCSGCHRYLDEKAEFEVAIQYWFKGIPRTQALLHEKKILNIN